MREGRKTTPSSVNPEETRCTSSSLLYIGVQNSTGFCLVLLLHSVDALYYKGSGMTNSLLCQFEAVLYLLLGQCLICNDI